MTTADLSDLLNKRVRVDDQFEGILTGFSPVYVVLDGNAFLPWDSVIEAPAPAPLVTIHVSPYITWQGPASRAAEAGRF